MIQNIILIMIGIIFVISGGLLIDLTRLTLTGILLIIIGILQLILIIVKIFIYEMEK